MASVETQAILLVHGPDRKGIVAAFSQTLFGHGCGIVSSEQHTDVESSVFYQRIVFDAAELHTDRVSLERGIEEVAGRLGAAGVASSGAAAWDVATVASSAAVWEAARFFHLSLVFFPLRLSLRVR